MKLIMKLFRIIIILVIVAVGMAGIAAVLITKKKNAQF